ncbi:MAG: Spy/CpxP family protein refolding chaperone [Acidobacteriota bacterium]
MTTRHTFFIAAGLVGALALGAGAMVAAQGPGGPGFGPGPRMGHGGPGGPGGPGAFLGGLRLGQLDLTDAQRDQIRGIREARQAEFRQIGERLRTARRALGEAVRGTAVNEAAIRAAAADVAAVEADAAVLAARVHAEILGVLTPEQVQKLEEGRAQADERMKQRQERRQERRNERRQGPPAGPGGPAF